MFTKCFTFACDLQQNYFVADVGNCFLFASSIFVQQLKNFYFYSFCKNYVVFINNFIYFTINLLELQELSAEVTPI